MSTPTLANSDPATTLTEQVPTERAPADADADEEPQNALTEKFTKNEWAALKELRVRAIKIRSSCHVPPTTNFCLVFSPRYLREGV